VREIPAGEEDRFDRFARFSTVCHVGTELAAYALRVTFQRFVGQSCKKCTSQEKLLSLSSNSYTPCLHVVLYQPEIPHNAGSVGRTCVAVGAKLWMVRPLGFRVDDYYLRRSGLDYWQYLQWQVVDDWQELTDQLPQQPFWYLSKKAVQTYTEVTFTPQDVLVFGCESRGLPDELLGADPGRCLRIPTRPQVRSLNLSNSVGVLAYEAQRQWGGLAGDGLS